MYYAQLHRPGTGSHEGYHGGVMYEEFVYWGGYNEDPELLLDWVYSVNRPGDRIVIWEGKLFDDLSFEQDTDEPYTSFEIPLEN